MDNYIGKMLDDRYEILDVIVLDAKVIDGESLGQCVCRLAKAE